MKIGDKVHYIGHEGAEPENGVIKSVHPVLLGYAWVVFHCAGNWGDYMNYTGQLTDISHLTDGWYERENINSYGGLETSEEAL